MNMKTEWVNAQVMERINTAEKQLIEVKYNLANSPENANIGERIEKIIEDIANLRGLVR